MSGASIRLTGRQRGLLYGGRRIIDMFLSLGCWTETILGSVCRDGVYGEVMFWEQDKSQH